MTTQEDITKILSEFLTTEFSIYLSPNQGNINRCFYVKSKGQDYILLETSILRDVIREASVLTFLSEKNFSAMRYLTTKSGDFAVDSFGKRYILSVKINGYSPQKFNEVDRQQVLLAAQYLARLHIHLKGYSETGRIENPQNTASPAQALKVCLDVKKILENKRDYDEYDSQINTIIDKKIEMIKGLLQNPPDFSRCPKQYCHGDYHAANLFFDDNCIVGLCDWEYFGKDYRIWEVIRAMTFICDIDYTGSMVAPIDFEKAELFLTEYAKIFPFEQKELDIALPLLRYKSICSVFILEKHYMENDPRALTIFPKKAQYWFWWENPKSQAALSAILTNLKK